MSDYVPQIVAFCCSNCASAAARISDSLQLSLPTNVRLIKLPCTGRVDSVHLMKALEAGADGVYVAGCQEDSCKYKRGIDRASAKVKQVQELLQGIGLEPRRVALFRLSSGKGHQFVEVAQEMTRTIQELGPSPLHE